MKSVFKEIEPKTMCGKRTMAWFFYVGRDRETVRGQKNEE